MKIAIIGDPHLGCSTYADKRSSDFSKQFNRAVDVAISSNVSGVFLLGDVFDSSAYRRNVDNFAASLGEVAESFVRLKTLGIPIFSVAGNHEYGRGRGGGEIRILSDLGFLKFLDDSKAELAGFEIVGISFKSNIDSFREALKKLGPPKSNSILLIHQFCSGSKFVPEFLAYATKKDLAGWPIVFAGHHHHYEDFDYALTPGSLEVHEATEVGEKGFIIYDLDSRQHEFIKLPPSRPVKYSKFSGQGKTADGLEGEISQWVQQNSSPGALLVIDLSGRLSSGRSVDINWNLLRSKAIQGGCLKLHIEGGLEDQVRSAPEIKATISFQEFMKKRFGERGKIATEYVESFKEQGDEFGSEILTGIIETSKKGKK